MAESGEKNNKRKNEESYIPYDPKIGNNILALDRLFGSKKVQKMALSFQEKVAHPIPSCAIMEIMKLEWDKSVLLNALDEKNVSWYVMNETETKLHQCGEIFETYCGLCSGKIINTPAKGCKHVIGYREIDWSVQHAGEIVYFCRPYSLICTECGPDFLEQIGKQKS